MFAYELHRMNHDERVREAAAERLARQAVKAARRAAKAAARSGSHESEGRVGAERGRFARAA
ncbi:hypothetical protein AB0D99_15165 [Streptomyces sp. NPDC047971]|uniref:hypothetical protein n=1 Tax=Streptomyces sp. NPDC047971 TaxID=3154499 RepID=UPI0034054EC6